MTKKVIGICFLVFAIVSSIEAKEFSFKKGTTQLSCSQGPALSTFILKENEESYGLRVHHEQGVDKAVIHSGEITPSDFDFLAEKAEVFRRMGGTYSLLFQKENCSINEHGGWHCYISEPTTVNDLNVRSLSFYLYPRRIQSAGLDYMQYELGIEVRKDGQIYNAQQSFYDNNCHFK